MRVCAIYQLCALCVLDILGFPKANILAHHKLKHAKPIHYRVRTGTALTLQSIFISKYAEPRMLCSNSLATISIKKI